MLPAEHFVFALLSAWIISQFHYWVVRGTIFKLFYFSNKPASSTLRSVSSNCRRLLQGVLLMNIKGPYLQVIVGTYYVKNVLS